MRYKALIFDLDGTILDTLDDLADSDNFALAAYGLPTRTRDEVRHFVGNGIRKLIERSVPAGVGRDITDAVYRSFTEHYAAHCADKTGPYPGIPELLAALKRAGYRLAVVSNKADFAVARLCEQYYPGVFDLSVGEREGIARKPAPDSVNSVLSQLGIDRNEAVYIGDSEVDAATAKNAGLPCIGVTWGFRGRTILEESGADEIVDEPAQILQLV